MGKTKIKRAHKQAERLAGKSGIRNPYALAASQVRKGHKAGFKRKAKRGK